ncbi:MAG: S1-like domain-containing RNA-binding protein [Bacteroidota bacterium]
MISIGEYQSLRIERDMPQGYYLSDDEGNEVLLPRNFVTPEMQIGDALAVFVYNDSEDRPVATTETPIFSVHEFAYLEVVDTNEIGAFCDWGLAKALFVPFRNQVRRLEKGEQHVIYMYLDKLTKRLVGTTKIDKYLIKETEEEFEMGEEVDLLVYAKTELGYNVIVDKRYKGLIYNNEIHQPIQVGQQLTGYIKPLRGDGKLDISLDQIGHQSIEPNAQYLLDELKAENGFLSFTDKSEPSLIRERFGISKKLFKKALGTLYRQQLVLLKEDGIYLK